MILVIPKWILTNEYWENKYEIHRLITVTKTSDGTCGICERLEDQEKKDNRKIEKFKGDIVEIPIRDLKVIYNSDNKEDEFERKKYLEEIHLILTGKEKL